MAASVERLGYGTIWIGGSPDADLAVAEQLLDATEKVTIATGIVNIWKSPAVAVAASFHRLEQAHPGRFVLGVGIGHREALGDQYRKPYSALVSYLDTLDAEGVPAHRRVISALGPRTLALSAERAAGTHPYLTTPVHTRFARDVVGPGPLVAPEQRLVPTTDTAVARDTARAFLAGYLALSNYRRTLESHGFTAAELDNGATDAAVDSPRHPGRARSCSGGAAHRGSRPRLRSAAAGTRGPTACTRCAGGRARPALSLLSECRERRGTPGPRARRARAAERE